MVALIPELMATTNRFANAPDPTLLLDPSEEEDDENDDDKKNKPKKQDPTASVEVVPIDEGYAPTYSTAAAERSGSARCGNWQLVAVGHSSKTRIRCDDPVIPDIDPGDRRVRSAVQRHELGRGPAVGERDEQSELLPGIVPVRLVFTWVDRHGISDIATRDQLVRSP